MHKGYTLNYFINFFRSIPSNKWTTGVLANADGTKFCALGLAGSARRNEALYGEETSDTDGLPAQVRAEALDTFLDGETAAINDGDGNQYLRLGDTPKARILRALRNRKNTGLALYSRSNR